MSFFCRLSHEDIFGANMSEFHPSFWAALTGWFLAQLIKMISCFLRSGKLDFSYLMSTGGMPSAHTSMVCSLATSIGLHEGFSTPCLRSWFVLPL